ncbi:MAG: hypothetical protein IAI50_05495 [Candidatus Eremiobacteraeota bacterium]|nr:hypothetical protein [Candidatus Eremiobacteraeota bacterium]
MNLWLALGLMLAQVQASASPSSVPSKPPLVRRGVDTAPRIAAGDITIRNSGSTNFAGYTVVVHPDGAADVTINGVTTPQNLAATETKALFDKVTAAAPLDAMPAGGCMKSASFGTSTTVSYGSTTSTDISCGGNPAMHELAQTVSAVVSALHIASVRKALRP